MNQHQITAFEVVLLLCDRLVHDPVAFSLAKSEGDFS